MPAGPVTVAIAAPPPLPTASSEGAPAVAVAAGDEGASDVALVLAGASALVSVEGGSLVRHADGTLTVLDDGGSPVGGFGAPRVVGPHGARPGDGTAPGDAASGDGAAAGEPSPGSPGVRVVLVDEHRAEVTLAPAAGTPSGTSPDATTAWDVVVPLGTQAVRSTDWGEREGGRSLAVDPTTWARAAGQAGQELVWAQLAAAEPEIDTPTMHDQLVCHAVGAPGQGDVEPRALAARRRAARHDGGALQPDLTDSPVARRARRRARSSTRLLSSWPSERQQGRVRRDRGPDGNGPGGTTAGGRRAARA
nr:DUF2599 domain-containing protein [Cellulosimicrobium cellulans]